MDLRVLVAVVNEATASEVQQGLVQLGAQLLQEVEIDSLPDVLVADTTQHALYKELTAVAPSIPVVTPAWVQECQRLNAKASCAHFRLGCFAGCKITTTGFSVPDREIWGNKVRENGGEYSADLMRPPHCTHLVSRPSKQKSKKLQFALSWKVEVVSEQWLADCIDLGRCLDPSCYQVDTHGILVEGVSTAVSEGTTLIRATSNGSITTGLADQPSVRPPSPKASRLNEASSPLRPAPQPPAHPTPKPPWDAPTQPVRPALGTSTMLTGCSWGCSRPHLYLEAVQLHAMGCDEALTSKIILNVNESGATRLPALLPQVTHVVVGPAVTSDQCQAVREHVSAYRHVQLVRPQWLDACVEAKMYVDPGPYLLTPTSMFAAMQQPQDQPVGMTAAMEEASRGVEDSIPDVTNRLSGMWFTLAAVQGTQVEKQARELILKSGGKLFDAQSIVLVGKSQAYAVCPMGMSPTTLAQMKNKYPDFQMVEASRRVTVHWLLDIQKYTPDMLVSVEHRPVRHDVPMSDFRKVVVHATGFDPEMKDKIRVLVEEVAGGTYLEQVAAQQLVYITHVITTDDLANVQKLCVFKKHGKHIVNVSWLSKSIREGRRLAEEPFYINLEGKEELSQVVTQLPVTQVLPRRSTRLSPNPDKKRSRDPNKQRTGSKLSQGVGTPGKGTQRTPKRQKTASSNFPADPGPSQRCNINLKPPRPQTGSSQRGAALQNDPALSMSQHTSSRAAAAAARLATPATSPPRFPAADAKFTASKQHVPKGLHTHGSSHATPPIQPDTDNHPQPSVPTHLKHTAYEPVPSSHRGYDEPNGGRATHLMEGVAQLQHQAPTDTPILPGQAHSNPPLVSTSIAQPSHSNPPYFNPGNPASNHSNPPGGAHSNPAEGDFVDPAGGAHSNHASSSSPTGHHRPHSKDLANGPKSGTGERISLFQRVMAAQSPPGLRAALKRSADLNSVQSKPDDAPSAPASDQVTAQDLVAEAAVAAAEVPADRSAAPAAAPGSENDWQAVEQMFDDLPLHKETLCETQHDLLFTDLGNSGQGSLPQPRKQQRGQKSQDSGGSGTSTRAARKRPTAAPPGQGRMTRQRQQLLQQQAEHMSSQFEMSQQIGYDTGPRPAERVTRGRLNNQEGKKRKEELLQKLQAVDTKTSRNPDRLQQLGLAE